MSDIATYEKIKDSGIEWIAAFPLIGVSTPCINL